MLASKTVIKQVAQPTALGPALKPSRGFFGGPRTKPWTPSPPPFYAHTGQLNLVVCPDGLPGG